MNSKTFAMDVNESFGGNSNNFFMKKRSREDYINHDFYEKRNSK
jgi:hypothetical protein